MTGNCEFCFYGLSQLLHSSEQWSTEVHKMTVNTMIITI